MWQRSLSAEPPVWPYDGPASIGMESARHLLWK